MMRMLLPNDTSSQNKTGNDDEDDGQTDKRLDNENKEKDDDDGDNSSDDLELDSEDESDEETYKPRYKYYGFLMDLLKCLEAEMAKQGNTFPEYEIREVEPSTDSSASSSSSSDKTDPPGTFYGGDKVTANGPVFSGILKEMKQAVRTCQLYHIHQLPSQFRKLSLCFCPVVVLLWLHFLYYFFKNKFFLLIT